MKRSIAIENSDPLDINLLEKNDISLEEEEEDEEGIDEIVASEDQEMDSNDENDRGFVFYIFFTKQFKQKRFTFQDKKFQRGIL